MVFSALSYGFGFFGPRIAFRATDALWGQCASKQCLGADRALSWGLDSRAPKTPNHQQWKPQLGTARHRANNIRHTHTHTHTHTTRKASSKRATKRPKNSGMARVRLADLNGPKWALEAKTDQNGPKIQFGIRSFWPKWSFGPFWSSTLSDSTAVTLKKCCKATAEAWTAKNAANPCTGGPRV